MEESNKIIKRHIYIAMAAGAIPIPFVDFVSVAGIQLNMLRSLAKSYKVPFSKDAVKNIIGVSIGGSIPASLSLHIGKSATKIIPGIGYAVGAIGTSIASGASTYAVGKVFDRHFSEGGTLLTFDAKKARSYYEEMFKEGQNVVDEIKVDYEKRKNGQQ